MTDSSGLAKRSFPRPQRVRLEGRYAVLEPLDVGLHGAELYAASSAPGAEQRFRYMGQPTPKPENFEAWLQEASTSSDPLFFAVIDRATGVCHGRQGLMRIVPEHGVIELGNIVWGPGIARTRTATEAFYLAAAYVFDELGYRRFEWKCDAQNAPSKRAAERFGFTYEGTFKQHMIVKGLNRDTAWFAMLDNEWPSIQAGFLAWLEPANFTADGKQLRSLAECRTSN